MTKFATHGYDALPAGTRLAEFEIEDVLGAGGFGIVYRALDHALERKVAIKEYMPSSLAGRTGDGRVSLRVASHQPTFDLGLRSFINEARLLARFDHPSLVKVYRFWEANDTAYMVMPCYQGVTLREARAQMDAPVRDAWLLSLLEPLLGALELLHSQHVFHRDVAPDNVLLLGDAAGEGECVPVLLDFGAARDVIGDPTRSLTAILKPSFAPIEQYAEATSLRQGPWTDLYALAAVAHYCITGRAPLAATARTINDELPRLAEMADALARDFGRSYSPGLLAAIDHALAVRPQDRPQSADSWRRELHLDVPRTIPYVRSVEYRRAHSGDDAVLPTVRVGGLGAASSDTFDRTQPTEPTAVAGRFGRYVGRMLAAAKAGFVRSDSTELQRERRATQATEAVPFDMGLDVSLDEAGPGLAGQETRQKAGQKAGHQRLHLWGAGAVVALAALIGAWQGWRATHGAAGPEALPTAAIGAQPAKLPAVSATALNAAHPVAGGSSGPALQRGAAQQARDSGAQAVGGKTAAGSKGSAVQAQRRAPAAAAAPKAGPVSPREACGDRNFFARAICMRKLCAESAYTQHAQCIEMRRMEEANRTRDP